MRTTLFRRIALAAVLTVVLSLFVMRAMTAGLLTTPQVLLAIAGFTFGYIVFRLSQAMFSASPTERRRARRELMFAAAVPVLILTPTAIESAPRDYVGLILLAAAIWLALAMSYTSFMLASASRVSAKSKSPETAPSGEMLEKSHPRGATPPTRRSPQLPRHPVAR